MSPECEHKTHKYTNDEWEDLQYLGLDFVFLVSCAAYWDGKAHALVKRNKYLVYFKLVLRVLERESKLHAEQS